MARPPKRWRAGVLREPEGQQQGDGGIPADFEEEIRRALDAENDDHHAEVENARAMRDWFMDPEEAQGQTDAEDRNDDQEYELNRTLVRGADQEPTVSPNMDEANGAP